MTDLYQSGVTHHVVLTVNSTDYGLMLYPDIRGYRQLDISDFSPRVAPGALTYRDFSVWQVVAQEDWRHGFGFPYYTDEAGYAKTDDGVDTRHDGIVMLATKLTTSETGYTVNKFVDFSSKVYAGLASNGGVRVYTPGTDSWAATTETTGTINDMLAIGTYLIVAPDGARARKFDGTTWSNVGNDSNTPTDMKRFCLHSGYFWASEDGNNYLHYASESDLSDLEGNGETDPGVIIVGAGNIPIVNMISFGGLLHVAREDGLYYIGDDNVARLAIDASRERHSNNFRTMCIFKNNLYYTVRQRIYRYTGSTLSDVTPPRYDEVYPYKTYGDFQNLTPRGNFLYVTARDTETSYNESLLSYDGVGWCKLWDVVTTPYVINRLDLSTITDKLWLNYTGTSTTTAYIPLQSLSDLPYASFPTSGTHYHYTSKFDAGFIDVPKTWDRLRVRTNNCSGTQTIAVAYSIDDGTFATLGTVNTSPYQELVFPACIANSTFGKFIQLRLNFSTASATQSPVLEAWALRYMLRPPAVWGFQLAIVLADRIVTMDDGVETRVTAKDLLDALEEARDQECPCTFIDPWGESHSVYVSSVQVLGTEWREGEGDEIEMIARISLAKV